MSGTERRTIVLDGRCGNCEAAIPRSYSYCPFCGAHWTVLEPTMMVRTIIEAYSPPRYPPALF